MLFSSYYGNRAAMDSALVTDPYFANVVLLCLQNDGLDANTAFIDQSSSAKAITAVGNAQWDTAQFPARLVSSLLLDGTGDYLTLSDSADWTLATGDYTLEAWVKYNVVGNSAILDFEASSASRGWALYREAGNLKMREGATIHDFGAWSPGTTSWIHLAVSRASSTTKCFLNGSQFGSNKVSANCPDIASTLKVGGLNWLSGYDLNGWLAGVRITKGVARYTTGFTAPMLPYPTT